MKFIARCLLIFALGLSAMRADLLYDVAEVPSPAGRNALGASLTKAPNGAVWLLWVEPAEDEMRALRFSVLDLGAKKWSPAQTVFRGKDLLATSAEIPALAVGSDGRITAAWPNGYGRVFFSQSTDRGATWSPPAPLTKESDAVEKISVVALPDGRVMAAWLDGRSAKTGVKITQLFARFLGEPEADHLVDASVCDCCQTALTAFPDGTALLAYRGRTAEEIRDILVASYLEGKWDSRHADTHDRWKIAGCPINGPRIASEGPRVTKAWFTAADDEPRVLIASSPDAGGIYTRPMRVDLGRPVGRVDALQLRDGSQLVTWVENTADAEGHATGSLYLRRYGPASNTLPPTRLATFADLRGAGFPRIALAKDFDATPAQFIATFSRPGDSSGVTTLLITLPEEELLTEADNNCECARHGEALRGSEIKGQIQAANPEKGTVRLRHSAVPGVLRAGEREFKTAPAVFSALKAPGEILGRIEQRDGTWWLFDVRSLGQPVR